MADDFNPYRAPDAPVVEDFIAVEPGRRSIARFVTAAICFGGAAFLISLALFAGAVMIAYPPRGKPRLTVMFFFLVPIAYATVAFLLAGRAFWSMRDRQGLILFLTAIGAFGSIFLAPLLFP